MTTCKPKVKVQKPVKAWALFVERDLCPYALICQRGGPEWPLSIYSSRKQALRERWDGTVIKRVEIRIVPNGGKR